MFLELDRWGVGVAACVPPHPAPAGQGSEAVGCHGSLMPELFRAEVGVGNSRTAELPTTCQHVAAWLLVSLAQLGFWL